MIITDYLLKGKNNMRTTKELTELTGLSTRALCKCVEQERIAGQVILSSSRGGYWLPDLNDPDIMEQLEHFINFMNSKNTFQTVKSAKSLLKLIKEKDQLKLRL